jgi:hypothetical protein
VARTAASARRLSRLFATLDTYTIETAALGGGIDERDGDRRFHWTCRTPCRLFFSLTQTPQSFAIGLAAADAVGVAVRATLRGAGTEQRSAATLALGGDRAWQDVWLHAERAQGGGDAGASVQIDLKSDAPATIFVGGIGPSPGPEVESAELRDELALRTMTRGRLVQRFADDVAHIFENPDALGEAWLATEIDRAADLDEVRRCLVASAQRTVACVADPARVPAAPADQPPGTLRIERSASDSLAVAVDAARDALLVVSRLDFPGWRATVDGTETEIVRVHEAMMGIVVPAGSHRVVLAYRPRSVLVGALVSLAGLVALVAWLRGGRRGPRRGVRTGARV